MLRVRALKRLNSVQAVTNQIFIMFLSHATITDRSPISFIRQVGYWENKHQLERTINVACDLNGHIPPLYCMSHT